MLINIDSTIHLSKPWLPTTEAARILSVRPETLYAYRSRGLLRARPVRGRRGSEYAAEDVEALLLKKRARSGHVAVAASALRWGEPVLDTEISTIDAERGPIYRGHAALDLVHRGISFEQVCALLWTGTLTERAPPLPAIRGRKGGRTPQDLVDRALACEDRGSLLETAWALLSELAPAPRSVTYRERVADRLGIARTARNLEWLEQVLVLLSDHELNASTFAARVVASAGATMQASLAAGILCATGVKHGAASLSVERWILTGDLRGDPPGFGHPLYRRGDPRARHLLSRLEGAAWAGKKVLRAVRFARRMALRGTFANVDYALACVLMALRAKRGSGPLVFVLGRVAGLLAHILEQQKQGALLRPRARYTGPWHPEAGTLGP